MTFSKRIRHLTHACRLHVLETSIIDMRNRNSPVSGHFRFLLSDSLNPTESNRIQNNFQKLLKVPPPPHPLPPAAATSRLSSEVILKPYLVCVQISRASLLWETSCTFKRNKKQPSHFAPKFVIKFTVGVQKRYISLLYIRHWAVKKQLG